MGATGLLHILSFYHFIFLAGLSKRRSRWSRVLQRFQFFSGAT